MAKAEKETKKKTEVKKTVIKKVTAAKGKGVQKTRVKKAQIAAPETPKDNNVSDLIAGYTREIDELKQLNNKLLNELYRFREAEYNIMFGDYELDIIGDKWTVSPSFNSIFGILENDLQNINSWIICIHPDDRQQIIKYFTTLLSGKEQFKAEYRIIRKDNKSIRWIFQTGFFDYDEFHNPSKMRGIIHDITGRINAEEKVIELERKLQAAVEDSERDLYELKIAEENAHVKIEELKKSENALKANEEKLKSITSESELLNEKFISHLNNMPMGYLEIDKNHILLDWNPQAEKIFGYKKKEAIGKNVLDLVVPESAKRLVESVADKLRDASGGTRSINENVTKDGRNIICDWFNTPLFDKDKNVYGWASLVNDISEQQNTLHALHESEEKIRYVFKNVPLGIVHFNSEGKVLDINDNLLLIVGETRERLLNKNMLLLDNPEIVKEIRKTLEGNKGSYEGKYVSEFSRKVISVKIEMAPVVREDGKVTGVVAILEDISEKKQIERIFFHDVVNTAGNLRGLAYVLSENLENQTKYKFAKLIQQQADQILSEIKAHRYLLASRSSDFKPEIKKLFSLDFLSNIVSSFSSAGLPNGSTLRIKETSKNVEFESDPSILTRVLGNMIKNALEASEHGEVITLGCSLEEGMITFWIHNNAVIPEAIQGQLFSRSVSTKGEGRGLGSYSLRILTEQFLKGKIFFTSVEGKGTTFVVYYPQKFS